MGTRIKEQGGTRNEKIIKVPKASQMPPGWYCVADDVKTQLCWKLIEIY